MTRVTIFACALFAALPFVRLGGAAQGQPVGKEQVIYEITVTSPGYKSQGWHGTLYDENGHAMQVEVGKTVMTDIGELVSTAAGLPWKPYGMVPTTPGMVNILMDDPWSYKLYGKDMGSKCSSWRGELLRDNVVIKPPASGDQVQTPMGTFIWLSESHGWAHKSWKVEVAKCGIGQPRTKMMEDERTMPGADVKSANGCVQVCQAKNRQDVNACMYPERTVEETKRCLATVKWNFDACMQACGK